MDNLELSPRARWTLTIVCLVAAACSLWLTRLHFLDDAFIHLRIAEHLRAAGEYSFNDDAPGYSTSSPLFTALLALASFVYDGVYLPKIASILALTLVLAILVREFLAAPARTAWLWLAFVAAVASPMGIRWLSDGMETSAVALVALVIAQASHRMRPLPWLFVLGCIATALRVEFSLALAVVGFARLVDTRSLRATVPALVLGAGGLFGLALIYAKFGSLLPDTALAKSHGPSGVVAAMSSLIDIAKVHVAASFFGIAVFCSWALSLPLALRFAPVRLVLAMNALLPLLIVLIVARHQAVQGYRYFVFVEFLLLAWNLKAIVGPPHLIERPAATPRYWGYITAVLACLMLVWTAHDFWRLNTIVAGRSETFLKFERGQLEDLRGRNGIAWDVGMVGYFSRARILDALGLVNGRASAVLTEEQRLAQFLDGQRSITFVFGNDTQLQRLAGKLDVSGWELRGTFDFPNFGGKRDRHYLLVRRPQ